MTEATMLQTPLAEVVVPAGHVEIELPIEAVPRAPDPPRRGLTLLQLTGRSCRWPIGDPRREGFCFCGATVQRRPYCEVHRQVAYRAPAQTIR
jgi:hypothetical protein